jgi:hypothetical protein
LTDLRASQCETPPGKGGARDFDHDNGNSSFGFSNKPPSPRHKGTKHHAEACFIYERRASRASA